jgi:Amt family ammonium transporter
MKSGTISLERGQYFARIRENTTRQKNWKLGLTIFAGKMIGLLIVLLSMNTLTGIIGLPANAADSYSPIETNLVNSLNTLWTLIAAALVFGMQAGFVMLEAGFARKRETVNVLIECVLDTAICGISFWAIGYAFMFSEGNGFIGQHWFFLQGAPNTYGATGVALLAHWVFQFAFADTASTITSGAMIGRTSFRGDILYSIAVTAFIYPIIGHWAWGPDGFLVTMGTPGNFLPFLGNPFRDFAGSTVVHWDLVLDAFFCGMTKKEAVCQRRTTCRLLLQEPSSCGLDGMVLIPAARFQPWMPLVLAVLQQIQHWQLALVH